MSSPDPIRQRLGYWIQRLHETKPGSIGDLLHFDVIHCDPAAGVYTMRADTESWMQNAFGSLHGGIIGTAMDQGMGMLATCLMEGKAITPTVQLDLTFHHPLLAGEQMLLKIYVDGVTRSLLYLRGQAYSAAEPERLCASATGIFFVKESTASAPLVQ